MKTEETIINSGETQVNVGTASVDKKGAANAEKSAAKWKQVTVGGASGILLGVAATWFATDSANAAEMSDAPRIMSADDELTLDEALDAARAELGPGQVFEWQGKIYSTYTTEEWENMSDEQRDEFYKSVVQQADVDEPAQDADVSVNIDVDGDGVSDINVRVDVADGAVQDVDVDIANGVNASVDVDAPGADVDVNIMGVEANAATPVDGNAAPAVAAGEPVAPAVENVVLQEFDVDVATSVNDDMSFNEAFAAARAEVGAGGAFEWHGKTYNTFYKEEWDELSSDERNEFYKAVDEAFKDVDSVEIPQDEISLADDVYLVGFDSGDINGGLDSMEINGENAVLVDVGQDSVFDISADNGFFSDGETADISSTGVGFDDFSMQMESGEDLLASNDMPDYMNDADVSMC